MSLLNVFRYLICVLFGQILPEQCSKVEAGLPGSRTQNSESTKKSDVADKKDWTGEIRRDVGPRSCKTDNCKYRWQCEHTVPLACLTSSSRGFVGNHLPWRDEAMIMRSRFRRKTVGLRCQSDRLRCDTEPPRLSLTVKMTWREKMGQTYTDIHTWENWWCDTLLLGGELIPHSSRKNMLIKWMLDQV